MKSIVAASAAIFFAAGLSRAEERVEKKEPSYPWEASAYVQASFGDGARGGFGGGGMEISRHFYSPEKISFYARAERLEVKYKKGVFTKSFQPTVLGTGIGFGDALRIGIAYAAEDGFRSSPEISLKNRWALTVGINDDFFNRGRHRIRWDINIYLWNALVKAGGVKQKITLATTQMTIGYAYRFGEKKGD